jgi:uncharacterized protein (TIGR00299 family) protein
LTRAFFIAADGAIGKKEGAMKILYFDCGSGISGDMTLGALLDLGLDQDYLVGQLRTLNVSGWSLTVTRRNRNGIHAKAVTVSVAREPRHHHHECGRGTHHSHRTYADIVRLIDSGGITPRAKTLAKNIFRRVAVAEAKVHGAELAEVHFHEVGAVDSIVDIVGVAVLVDALNADKICCSVVNDGHGFAHCQHGQIPVPVPAVAEIFTDPKVRWRQIDVEQELVTPTGAAIVAELCESFGMMPELRVEKVGYGAGTRETSLPGVVRAVVGTAVADDDRVSIVETNIDDSTPEILGHTMERLLAVGANDVWFTPIQMKKNRPAVTVSVLCSRDQVDAVAEILFAETSTIGARVREERRRVLPREIKTVTTAFGELPVKVVTVSGRPKITPEYEDARRLARQHNVPLTVIYAAAREQQV